MKFFVAKVDIEKVTFDGDQLMLSPLRFHYDSEEFQPLRFASACSTARAPRTSSCTSSARTSATRSPTIRTSRCLPTWTCRTTSGSASVSSTRRCSTRRSSGTPGRFVTEYAWQASNCDPCPGPVLDASVLMTLGADVLPGMSGSRRADARFGAPTVAGDLDAAVAGAVVGTRKAAIIACYQGAVDRSTSIQARRRCASRWARAVRSAAHPG